MVGGGDRVSLALTKTLHPEDYDQLAAELEVVDRHMGSEAEQHPARRWEYAMALRAARTWGKAREARRAADVGGAGSPLVHMLRQEGFLPIVIDPRFSMDLDRAVHLHELRGDFVTCISTVEHVSDLLKFVEDLAKLTNPGGCVFLTMDIWDPATEDAPDTAHFHWMRERIFTPRTWRMLGAELSRFGFSFLGEQDWEYHGDQLFGSYSFASLVMGKGGG
jgi:hypothetical protein